METIHRPYRILVVDDNTDMLDMDRDNHWNRKQR